LRSAVCFHSYGEALAAESVLDRLEDQNRNELIHVRH
jgi:hypothetical protein